MSTKALEKKILKITEGSPKSPQKIVEQISSEPPERVRSSIVALVDRGDLKVTHEYELLKK